MDRRSFMAASLAATPVAALPGAAAAHSSSGSWKVLSTRVANRDQFADAPLPAEGEVLNLVRAPDRRYDPNSISVLSSAGAPLGFLPPAGAGVLAALLDVGFRAHARTLRSGPRELAVEVWLDQDLDGVRWGQYGA